jgi:cysteinyl-tRNA synthetase
MKSSLFSLLLLVLLITASCKESENPVNKDFDVDFKEEMRTFVKEIGAFARNQDPDFILIPQNGHRLVSSTAEDDGEPVMSYLNAVDGLGQEDLYYGYDNDDQATPASETEYMEYFLDLGLDAGKTILVTDYTSTPTKMDDSFSKNTANDYASFAADHRELDNIPSYPDPIRNENSDDILSLSDAQNFLYLINPDGFTSKAAFLNAVAATSYDVIIMDAYFGDSIFTSSELDQIKTKANGGSRLVISYMSIGEAEDYRYYWQSDWKVGSPEFILTENPDWEGNYKVTYWEDNWKDIIFGNANSYTQKLLNAGFDGAYLDIIEGFEFFEE